MNENTVREATVTSMVGGLGSIWDVGCVQKETGSRGSNSHGPPLSVVKL